MVNGRIAQEMPAARTGRRPRPAGAPARRALGRRPTTSPQPRRRAACRDDAAPTQVFTVRRAHGDGAPSLDDLAPRTVRGFNRWNAGGAAAPVADIARDAPDASAPSRGATAGTQRVGAGLRLPRRRQQRPRRLRRRHLRHQRRASSSTCASAWRSSACASSRSTCPPRGKPSPASVHPREVARHHPQGEAAVFTRRPRQRRHRHGARPSSTSCARGATSAASSRPAARAAPRWPRRHARAADRRAQGDGLDDGQRRHAALRRPERHLHDVFGDRRAGHQPHQREGAGQCRARAGRHDRAPAGRSSRPPSRRSA